MVGELVGAAPRLISAFALSPAIRHHRITPSAAISTAPRTSKVISNGVKFGMKIF